MLNTLNVSQTGLNAARIAVENVSSNIANANTDGYKKRVVQLNELSQIDSQMAGRGVSVSGTFRVTSQYMYDKLTSENTKLSYYNKLSTMTGNIQSAFTETTDTGFSADLNRYYQSVEDLRTDPTSQIYKASVQNQGNILVGSLQNLYSSIEEQQKNEKSELHTNVDDVNSILKQISLLNDQMQKTDGVSNELLDKRDQLELGLSNYADISVNRQDGNYELKIGGQTAIYNTSVRPLAVKEEDTLQKDKFTVVDASIPGTTPKVYDALKYNSDFSAKTFDTNDVVTYKLNNQSEVSVTMGESITMDWNGDGTKTTEQVDSSNLTRALAYKINSDPDMKGSITAYNGDYTVDASGNKVTNNNQDNYLRIESNIPGKENQFDGRISIQNINDLDASVTDRKEVIYRNELQSSDPESKVSITIYDNDVPIKSGIMKAQVDNLSTDSPNNKFQSYLDQLDAFAQTFSDISDKYIKTNTGYVYGEAATDKTLGAVDSIGLFSGSSVKTLKFNDKMVNELDQNKLDYLATIQWKEDLSFDGKAQTGTSTSQASLSEFFRNLRVNISADKESVDFSKTTQSNVKMAIQSSYNQLTKVNNDKEMLDLIKFQAAYTANAKVITTIDEMLQTLLGLKR